MISSASPALTTIQVNDLLGLKQQQASVVQAYEAMKQGEETVRQGKAIMVFTVMTILFVRDPTNNVFLTSRKTQANRHTSYHCRS